MGEVVLEKQGTSTYMVYKITKEDVIDSMSLGMLTNNRIPGFATTLFTQRDTEKFIKYNISSKITAKKCLSGTVNKQKLLEIFKGITNTLLSAEEYMIADSSILLDLNYIFTDATTFETVLICLPLQKMTAQDIRGFFKRIMFDVQFDQTENGEYVTKILSYLNGTTLFSLSDFKELLENIEHNNLMESTSKESFMNATYPVQQKVSESVIQKPELPPKSVENLKSENSVNSSISVKKESSSILEVENRTAVKIPPAVPKQSVPKTHDNLEEKKKITMLELLTHYNQENAQLYKAQKAEKKKEKAKNTSKSKKKKGKKEKKTTVVTVPSSSVLPPASQPPISDTPVVKGGIGETTVLTAGETTVLVQNATQMIAPHLIRMKNLEKVSLNKPVFRIGKEQSSVDYVVSNNNAISRSHADFLTKNGEYFVVDLQSTNHVYVNSAMIPANIEMKISHGDKIRLADEDFEFKLY